MLTPRTDRSIALTVLSDRSDGVLAFSEVTKEL
jgi:hypothetical protein